jgi:plastocyanin domain-containing protein
MCLALSVIMLFALPACSIDSGAGTPGSKTAAQAIDNPVVDGVQIVNSTLSSGGYPKITVQAGVPVKWTIEAPKGSINGCNGRLIIPTYGVEQQLQLGANVIEFTPDKVGKVSYSCWMGMIRSSITVVEATQTSETVPENGQPSGDVQENIDSSEEFEYFENEEITEAISAGVKIPTEEVLLATKATEEYQGELYPVQEVQITWTKDGFSPAILVVESGLDIKWTIINESDAEETLLIPIYGAQLVLESGDNIFYVAPDTDFDFSSGDNTFYGYVKVLEDLTAADISKIQEEVSAFETMIYPLESFADCCN